MSHQAKAPTKPRIVGHGQLLKLLATLPDWTVEKRWLAALHLAYAQPPELRVFVKASSLAKESGCSTRSVERCRAWLLEHGAVTITGGGGRGRSAVIDFSPLAKRAKNPDQPVGVSPETPTRQAETPTGQAETPTGGTRVYEKDPYKDPNKDRADARATKDAHAAQGSESRRADPAKAAFYAQRIQRRLRGELVDQPAPEPLNAEAVVDVLEAAAATGTNGERS